MPAVNRRGRAIDCVVRVAPLAGTDEDVIGVILLMDAHDGVGGPRASATGQAMPRGQSDPRASSQSSTSDAPPDDA